MNKERRPEPPMPKSLKEWYTKEAGWWGEFLDRLSSEEKIEVGKALDVEDSPPERLRQFTTGANRDTNEEKLEYARFISPLVIKRYAEYMHKHRFLANGEKRDPDNWQKLFGENHQQVCVDSLFRHVMDLWLINDGYEGREDIEEALCGILFNAMAILYKVENDKQMLPKKGTKKTN